MSRREWAVVLSLDGTVLFAASDDDPRLFCGTDYERYFIATVWANDRMSAIEAAQQKRQQYSDEGKLPKESNG